MNDSLHYVLHGAEFIRSNETRTLISLPARAMLSEWLQANGFQRWQNNK